MNQNKRKLDSGVTAPKAVHLSLPVRTASLEMAMTTPSFLLNVPTAYELMSMKRQRVCTQSIQFISSLQHGKSWTKDDFITHILPLFEWLELSLKNFGKCMTVIDHPLPLDTTLAFENSKALLEILQMSQGLK